MRRRACYHIIIKGHLADTHGGQMTDSGQIYENYSSEREITARWVKVIEFKGYNIKIVSAGKDLERRSPKTRPILSSLRPTVDMALIPLCNTRFIKRT